MIRRPRALAVAVVLAAFAGGLLWGVSAQTRQLREFYPLRDEGTRIILGFAAVPPEGVAAGEWREAVLLVAGDWDSAFDVPGVLTDVRVGGAVEELRRLAAGLAPQNSAERLEGVFDVLLRHRPERARQIELMREVFRSEFPRLDTRPGGPA